jgi:hypothetical protein
VSETEPDSAKVGRARAVGRWFAKEGAGTIVALATGITALLFTLFPGLKPFTPTKLSAQLWIQTVDRAVTRDQWRWEIAQGDPRKHAQLVAQDREVSEFKDGCGGGTDPGYVVYVRSEADGYKRRQLKLRASLYDAATKRAARDATGGHDVLAAVPIDAPTVISVQRIWVYDPRVLGARGSYIVRVELYDKNDNLLAFTDSKPVAELSSRELRQLPDRCLAHG